MIVLLEHRDVRRPHAEGELAIKSAEMALRADTGERCFIGGARLISNGIEPIEIGIFSDLRRGCTIRRILKPDGLDEELRCARDFW